VLKIRRDWSRIDPKLLNSFGSFFSSQLSDAHSECGVIGLPIKRLHGKGVIMGSALTVSTLGAADNLAPYAALKLAQPGDIVVIASQSCDSSALIGDNLVGLMRNAGVVGVVTDGLVRDAVGLEAIGLPIHARGYCPKAPSKQGPGTVGLPIQLSGVTINSGDFVIADEDGVVSVAPSLLIEILEKLQYIQRKDQAKMDLINSGATLPPDLDALLDLVGIDWQDH
jgi:4-hydroxy-4-methyl-2-oxoglutarate aldolase